MSCIKLIIYISLFKKISKESFTNTVNSNLKTSAFPILQSLQNSYLLADIANYRYYFMISNKIMRSDNYWILILKGAYALVKKSTVRMGVVL